MSKLFSQLKATICKKEGSVNVACYILKALGKFTTGFYSITHNTTMPMTRTVISEDMALKCRSLMCGTVHNVTLLNAVNVSDKKTMDVKLHTCLEN